MKFENAEAARNYEQTNATRQRYCKRCVNSIQPSNYQRHPPNRNAPCPMYDIHLQLYRRWVGYHQPRFSPPKATRPTAGEKSRWPKAGGPTASGRRIKVIR